MRTMIAITQVTLDGIMQAPGGPEEDPSNGFTHGGWAMPFMDDDTGQAIGEIIAGEFDLLLGRRTYQVFAGYWPQHDDNPIGKAFNQATKYVVTRTLDQLDWNRSQRIGGEIVDDLRRLKASDGPALHVWGMLFAGRTAFVSAADLVIGSFSVKGVVTAVVTLLIIAGFFFLDWRTLLEKKQLRFDFHIWK